jgi:hypothetical protein
MSYRTLPVTANGQTHNIGLYDPPAATPATPDPLGVVNLSGRIEAPDSRDAIGWGVGGAIGGAMLAGTLDVFALMALAHGAQPIHAGTFAVGVWAAVPVCFSVVFGLRLTARQRLDTRQREALPPKRTYVKVDKSAEPVIVARPIEPGENVDKKRYAEKLMALVARAADGNTKVTRRDGRGERFVFVEAINYKIKPEEHKRLYDELATMGVMTKDSDGAWRLVNPQWTKNELLDALVEALADDD